MIILFSWKGFLWEKFMKIFTEHKFFGENLSSFYNTKCKMNISYWPLNSIRDNNTSTKYDWYEKGIGLTLAVGWRDSELFVEGFILKLLVAGKTFIPSYWMGNKNIVSFFYRFSLSLNWLVNICHAYEIQSVNWTYEIGLSIQQETKKQGQNYWY